MTVVLAHDIGPQAGLGHQTRMRALAAALNERDIAVSVLPVEEVDRAEVLVVDSYRVRADEKGRFSARVVVAVDDLDRDLDVDLVVDPNPGASDRSGRARHRLAGPRFALLVPCRARWQRRDAVLRALVTMGGADTTGLGATVAERLAGLLPQAEVRLVIGPWSATRTPAGVTPVVAPSSLAEEIAAADVAITAGGVTMLELLNAGVPTVALVTAPNQERAVAGAADAHAVARTDAETAAETAAELAADAVRCESLSAAAIAYVDGRGAERVAEAIIALI